MTKEERAEKWFRNIPNAETIDLETRMEICSKVANKMLLVFFVVLALEIGLLFLIGGDAFLNDAADFLNNLIEGVRSRKQHKITVFGICVLALPLIVLPLIAAVVYKKKGFVSAVNRALGIANRGEAGEQWATDNERQQFSDWLGKFYSDWVMDVNITSQEGFTPQDVKQQLAPLKQPDCYDIICLWPSGTISIDDGYNFSSITIYSGETVDRLDVEVSTIDIAYDNHVIKYGKNNLSEREVMEILRSILDDHIILKLDSWKVLMDYLIEKSTDAENYKAIVRLLPDGETLLSKVERCIDSPRQYFTDNVERYREREMDETERNCDIIWVAIANGMLDSGNAIEVDWQADKEEFCLKMKGFANKYNLELREELLEEGKDMTEWCKVLNEQWSKQGLAVAEFEIDSDSCIFFISQCETIEKLIKLSGEVNQIINFANEM